MRSNDQAAAEVLIVGRCNFGVGIGALTYAFCEALARHMPVAILPTEPHLRAMASVRLPSGRAVPVYTGGPVKASFFVDVVWNGQHDRNTDLVPSTGVRFAYFVGDSDLVAVEAVRVMNERFDVVLVPSAHLQPVLAASGVRTPVAVAPAPLPLEDLLGRPYRRPGRTLRIGSMAAFHPRKCLPKLVEAFAKAFGQDDAIDLHLHSNLAFGDEYRCVQSLIDGLGIGERVTQTIEDLAPNAKNDLLASFDIFANFSRGEAYSIGAREALALGKPLVLSAVGGHLDLEGAPGVFLTATSHAVPARYPEIDNRVLGWQREVEVTDAAQALRDAVAYLRGAPPRTDVLARRKMAAGYSFSRLSAALAALLEPGFALRPIAPEAERVLDLSAATAVTRARMQGQHGLTHRAGVMVAAHDGGFFSVFNTYMSHLVWGMKDGRCAFVVPDWDVKRLLARHGRPLTSFCYGRPEDGNVWLKLFEPVFGLSPSQLNDPATLSSRAAPPMHVWNEAREPLLTHVNAAELYKRPWFTQWRLEYHAALRRHVRLQPFLSARIENFVRQNFRKTMIAAHVRHPSHAIEQPGGKLANAAAFMARIKALVAELNLSTSPNSDWGIFLATDQEAVVQDFVRAFGRRVVFYPTATRTSLEDTARFLQLSREEQLKEGRQVQHVAAADMSLWSSKLAEEVICDAYTMARCDHLVHAVSNISTAVSYLNPGCRLVSCP
jgi:glycosyltransferase involved in cell wall biosynthesis